MPRETIDNYGIKSETADLTYTTLNNTTPEEIVSVVRNYAKGQKDREVVLRALRLSKDGLYDDNSWIHGETNIRHTTYAFGQLLTYLKIPRLYFRRCPTHLQEANFNWWKGQKGDKTLLARSWQGVIRAFFTTRFSSEMDDIYIMPVVMRALAELDTESQYSLNFSKTGSITRLVLRFQDLKTTEIDDIPWTLQGGIEITNSEIGLSSLRIQPCVIAIDDAGYSFHLADYTAPGTRRFKHVGDAKKLETVAEALNTALKVAENAVPVALNSLMLRVERPRKALENIYHSNPFITQTAIDGIIKSLEGQEEVLKGDIVSAVIKACESVMPFQTKLHERIEAERGMAKYLGFLDGLDEQLGNIMTEAVVMENTL